MNMHRFCSLQMNLGKLSPLTELSTVNILCETVIKAHSFIIVKPNWVVCVSV